MLTRNTGATQEKVHVALQTAVLLWLLAAPSSPALGQAVADLRDQARRAEARYERVSRTLAPVTWTRPMSGSECDEVIGRFCLRHDSLSPPRVEPPADGVIDALRDAIHAYRAWFSAAPSDPDAAGPLLRLLAVHGRYPLLAETAWQHHAAVLAAGADTVMAAALLGYALHRAGHSAAAQDAFDRAIAGMAPERRTSWLDLEWLLLPREHDARERLDSAAVREYDRRFWLLSDPFWSTAPNERWLEHLARRVEVELMESQPTGTGGWRWGEDLAELTVRYGMPSQRERMVQPGLGSTGMVEHSDSAQRALSPDSLLLAGYPAEPDPGSYPRLYASRARSAWAPPIVERVLELPHQATRRMVAGMPHLRVDGWVPDSLVPRPPLRSAPLVIVYDSTLRTRQVFRASWTPTTRPCDAARCVTGRSFTAMGPMPAGSGIYAVELLDSAAGVGLRARHALPPRDSAAGASDILLARGGRTWDAADALPDATVTAGDTVFLLAEVYGADGPMAVELALEDAVHRGSLHRLARWIGRQTGLGSPEGTPRLRWVEQTTDDDVHGLALALPLPPGLRGLHDVVLRVRSAGDARAVEVRRRVRIERRRQRMGRVTPTMRRR